MKVNTLPPLCEQLHCKYFGIRSFKKGFSTDIPSTEGFKSTGSKPFLKGFKTCSIRIKNKYDVLLDAGENKFVIIDTRDIRHRTLNIWLILHWKCFDACKESNLIIIRWLKYKDTIHPYKWHQKYSWHSWICWVFSFKIKVNISFQFKLGTTPEYLYLGQLWT